MNSGIYKITNTCNGKVYIGSSVNLKEREYRHFLNLKKNKHPNVYLQRVYNKYGGENFKFEVIEYVEDVDKLLSIEQFYIDDLMSYNENIGYNLAKNTCSPMLGKKFTDKHKIKISKAHNGSKNPSFGKHPSVNTRKKLSESKLGNNYALGRKQTDEEINSRVLKLNKKIINITTGHIYDSIKEASIENNINGGNLSSACSGRQKTAGGYMWGYYNGVSK